MSELTGQITIGGEVIAGVQIVVTPLTLNTLPEGLTEEDLPKLSRATHGHAEFDFVITRSPYVDAKYDAKNGLETGARKGVIYIKPIRDGFTITETVTPEEREQQFRDKIAQADVA